MNKKMKMATVAFLMFMALTLTVWGAYTLITPTVHVNVSAKSASIAVVGSGVTTGNGIDYDAPAGVTLTINVDIVGVSPLLGATVTLNITNAHGPTPPPTTTDDSGHASFEYALVDDDAGQTLDFYATVASP